MRRKDKEITDDSVIQEILAKSRICRLGLVENEEAYIVPVNYGYQNGNIYIHSAAQGRKMEILKKNNLVAFEIEYSEEVIKDDKPCEWSARYRSVMGRGTVNIVTDPTEKKAGLDIIMRKHGSEGELIYDESSVSRIVLLVLRINSISGKQSGTW